MTKTRTHTDDNGNTIEFQLLDKGLIHIWMEDSCHITLERLRIIVEQLEEAANAQNN